MQGIIRQLLNLLLGSFSGGLTLFFVVVLAIFVSVAGEPAWNGILRWLPPWWRDLLGTQLPLKVRGFIIGQVSIVVGFSLVLAAVLTLIGVRLGLLFGFLIGMASLLPFARAIAQVAVSLFWMLQDFTLGLEVFVEPFDAKSS